MDVITVKLEEKQRMYLSNSNDTMIPSIEGIKLSPIINIMDLNLVIFIFQTVHLLLL